MDNLSFLLGLNANNGGGTASTPTWSDVTGKPFDTIGTGLTVTAGALETVGGTSGATPTWSEITSKPFSTVDTTTGLTIVDDTLMLETLDTVATIDYVDTQIDGVTTTLESDYALKTEIPDVSSFITASALTPYAESADLAAVATSGSYADLSNTPSIPVISATATLATGTQIGEIEIDGATTTFYAPAGGGTAPTPNWNATSGQDGYIENKPNISAGSGTSAVRLCNASQVAGNYAIAIGSNCFASQNYSFSQGEYCNAMSPHQHVQGKNNVNNYQGTIFADIIGNGTDYSHRSNAEATDWSGNKYLAGDVYVGVSNWASPTTGASKLPKQADFDWASANGYVIDNSDVGGSVDWAQEIIDNQSYDEWGQPEYTGEIDTVYAFKYYINHTIHNESTDEDVEYDGYYWNCESADPVPNPNYNVDPNQEPEEEPEEEPEG